MTGHAVWLLPSAAVPDGAGYFVDCHHDVPQLVHGWLAGQKNQKGLIDLLNGEPPNRAETPEKSEREGIRQDALPFMSKSWLRRK